MQFEEPPAPPARLDGPTPIDGGRSAALRYGLPTVGRPRSPEMTHGLRFAALGAANLAVAAGVDTLPDQLVAEGPRSSADTVSAPATRRGRSEPSTRPPRLLLGASLAVAAALVTTPVAFLVVETHHVGLRAVLDLVWRPLTAKLLWNTCSLTAVVTASCAVVGTLAAWCVERTDLPARRVWGVLLVLPFAVPAFVVSWGWESITTWVAGFRGAALVMTLTLYPLVYLFVAASLRSSDPGLEEAARGLGLGRVRTFARVTLAQARGAILGGCVVVALILLAEYGAFEDLGFQTFTMEIFREFQISFSIPTACALTLVLLGLAIVVLAAEALAQGNGRVVRVDRLAQREITRHRLGRATVPVVTGLAALVGLGVAVPVGSSIYWFFEGGAHTLAGGSMLLDAAHTVLYSATAGVLATVSALPVALLAARHPGRGVRLLERSTFLVLAIPGLVIALALSYFSENDAHGFAYQSAPMLIVAYALLFFPLALVGVRASAIHVPVDLEQAASSLGQSRLVVFRRVTLRLVLPGLATGFCLVFIAAVTELTATLVLVPAGVQTLATQFWAYEENLSYGQAAPYALVMIAVVAVPAYVLARCFQRLPTRGIGPR